MPNRLLQDSTTDLLYLQGGGGGSYSGISPVVVDNVNGTIGLSQPDLVSSISGNFYPASNPSGFIDSGYVSGMSASAASASEVLTASAGNWNSTYGTVCANSASWASGHEYSGIDPIYVDNANDTISAATWDIQFGSGFSAVDDSVNRTTTVSIDSKEFNVAAPLALTETTSSFDLSISGDIGGPRVKTVTYGTDTWSDVVSAMEAVSSGKYDYVVMKYSANGTEFYAPMTKYASGSYAQFVCPANATDESFGYGQRKVTDIFTINSGNGWSDARSKPFQGRLIGRNGVTVSAEGEDYIVSGGSSEIHTDLTLTGSGTSASPLGISYPLNPANNEATATFNQYGMSTQDSDGYKGYYGTTGMTVVSGTASASADLQSIRNWNSTYDNVEINSGTWSTVTDKLDISAQVVTAVGTTWVGNFGPFYSTPVVSSINGSAVLPYGYSVLSGNSANWNSTYDTVSTYSGSWGGGTVEHDTNLSGDGSVNSPLGLSRNIVVSGVLPSITVQGYNDGKSAKMYGDSVTFWGPGSGGELRSQYGADGFDLTYNGGEYYHTELKTVGKGITLRYLGNTNWSANYATTAATFTDPTGTEGVSADSIRTWNSAANWIDGLGVNDIVYTASLPASPDASTLYLIPEA